jgi:hypothetical protein
MTGDQSWILWHNEKLGSWLEIDEELCVRVRRTIGARKSMLTVFFNPKTFAVIDCLPEGTPFNAAYFVAQVVNPLHQLHSTATGDDARRKLRVHFDNSPCHTARVVSDEMARLRCRRIPHPPYSPDLAICDFYLFGRIQERLAGVMAIDGDDLRNEVISILAEMSEEEKIRAATTGSKDGNRSPNIMEIAFMSKTTWSISFFVIGIMEADAKDLLDTLYMMCFHW